MVRAGEDRRGLGGGHRYNGVAEEWVWRGSIRDKVWLETERRQLCQSGKSPGASVGQGDFLLLIFMANEAPGAAHPALLIWHDLLGHAAYSKTFSTGMPCAGSNHHPFNYVLEDHASLLHKP